MLGISGVGLAAISLALVGRAVLSERIRRNACFASIGNGLAAGVMGIAGCFLPVVSVFLVSALLAMPALLSLINGTRAEPACAGVSARHDQRQDDTKISWKGMKTPPNGQTLRDFRRLRRRHCARR